MYRICRRRYYAEDQRQIVKDKKKMDAKSVEEFQEQIGIKFHEPSRLWNASFIVPMQMNEE